jgi:hypothetical protein
MTDRAPDVFLQLMHLERPRLTHSFEKIKGFWKWIQNRLRGFRLQAEVSVREPSSG